jgi:uroporphyrin-III C-methyltransferase/precorrin-2 dehydrogenase/sirohydrochlorin ferrochelatase
MDVLQLPRNDSPARMDRLAKLPVFWALEGRRVVVAGGTDAAAWKAELLAACGAEVHVYAEQLSETFQHLIAQGAAHPQGRFIHHPHAWDRTTMIGATIAIADCEQEDEAQAFFDAARDAGVPVNVIDKPPSASSSSARSSIVRLSSCRYRRMVQLRSLRRRSAGGSRRCCRKR